MTAGAELVSRQQIRKDLAEYDNKEHEQSPAHLEYLAGQCYDQHDYEDALYYIEQVISENPSHYAYYRRAKIYCKLLEYDNALEDLQVCLSIEPEFDIAIELKELILEKIAEDKKYCMTSHYS